MTFLNDLWKKFKTPPDPKRWGNSNSDIKNEQAVLDALQQTELEREQKNHQQENLQAIRTVVAKKNDSLSIRFSQITKRLGASEIYESVRQERWFPEIECPECQSHHLKRLPAKKNIHNHRYICLDCDTEFADGDELPEPDLPPINLWMQCWYLMGCSDSLTYIAATLGVDLATVEFMTEQLKFVFNSNAPLTNNVDFKEWDRQSEDLRKQLQNDLIKRFELLDANVTTAPKDTGEFRRQQNLRRTLTASTASPPAKPNNRKR